MDTFQHLCDACVYMSSSLRMSRISSTLFPILLSPPCWSSAPTALVQSAHHTVIDQPNIHSLFSHTLSHTCMHVSFSLFFTLPTPPPPPLSIFFTPPPHPSLSLCVYVFPSK